MRLSDELNGGLKELERELRGPDGEPQTVVIGALTLPCVPTTVTNGVVIDAEGNAQTVKLSLLVRLEHFQAPGLLAATADTAPDPSTLNAQAMPTVGRLARFRWANYRIVDVAFDSAQTAMRLDLADPASNQ